MKSNNGYTRLPTESATPHDEAYPPPQAYPPQQGYSTQGYASPVPAQGYPPQQGYPPAQGYPPQGYASPVQTPVYVTNPEEPLFTTYPPFVYTNESILEQVANLPSYFLAAVTKPSVKTYEDLKMKSSWPLVFLMLFVRIIIVIIMAVITYEINKSHNHLDSSEEKLFRDSMAFAVLFAAITTPIWFFFVNGFFTGFAKCMAGNRVELESHPLFLQYCFCSLLINFVLGIFTDVIGWIPKAGPYIALIVVIYQIVLWVIAMRAIFHVTTGQAIGIIVLFVLTCAVVLIILVVAFSYALFALLFYGSSQ